jgi:hypothetical protein
LFRKGALNAGAAVSISLMAEHAAASEDEGNALLVLLEHATFTLPVIWES